ncbi:hypothetical protein P3L10_015602 [Capsicum annuum]|uniref:uncharacterized protein LOC107871755 n=1 Tax=Capsicum annuum TaxID=4072 RepID=UPI0007BF4C9D|nr:uncharacterized protein LOC107871755 [Capsicum annuum]
MPTQEPKNSAYPSPENPLHPNIYHHQTSGSHNLNPIYVEILSLNYSQPTANNLVNDYTMQDVVERLRHLEENKGIKGLNYEDLCIHPDVELSKGYKPPKCELYNGIGDPKVHLRVYYDKLVGVGKNEKIWMKLFMRSLMGESLTWYIEKGVKKWAGWLDVASSFVDWFGYNTDNALSWTYMQAMRKKPNKSFHEYAMRWRAEPARALPSGEEQQIKKYFIKSQEPQYHDKMIKITDKSFSEIIRIGEIFEESLKNGSIIHLNTQSIGAVENK